MRINEIGSFKPSIAMKGLKTGAMSREIEDKTARIDGAGTSNFTVVLWFLLGLICPPFLLCGCRYLSSPSKVAKMLGALSIFMFVTYVMVGVIVFATLWKPDKWSGHLSFAMIPYLEHRPLIYNKMNRILKSHRQQVRILYAFGTRRLSPQNTSTTP